MDIQLQLWGPTAGANATASSVQEDMPSGSESEGAIHGRGEKEAYCFASFWLMVVDWWKISCLVLVQNGYVTMIESIEFLQLVDYENGCLVMG